MRRFIKALLIVAGGFAIIAAALYQFAGLRVVLDGAGRPHLAVVESAEARAAAIERHRAAQQGASDVPSAAGSDAGAVAAPPETPPPALSPARAAVLAGPAGNGHDAAAVVGPSDGAAGLPADTPPAPYWTQFRGPVRDGAYRERPILTAWPDSRLKPLWKQPVGGGYASFAIARGRAFTIEQRRAQEVVVAYDVETGRELWSHAWDGEFREFMGGDGPRATPTWSDGRVYALGALGELRCLEEASGRPVWRRNILEDARAANLQWGMAASPLIVDDTVIVLPGGAEGRSVVAYDKRSGAMAWSALDDKQAFSSPMIVTLAGRRQLLTASARRLMGLTPDAGTLLWELPWRVEYDITASQPLVIGDNRVFMSSSYGTGAALIEVVPDGAGLAVKEIWRTNRMKNRFSSSVYHDGYIYGLDEAILACLDAATGDLKWKAGRYGYGQIALASGHLIVLAEDGDLALVRATPDRHEEVARVSALTGKTWNHPAFADGRLLVRNLAEMAAFDLRIGAADERTEPAREVPRP
jgi:outer membrane protein assembly factor BamB